jgi:hypothetical protein
VAVCQGDDAGEDEDDEEGGEANVAAEAVEGFLFDVLNSRRPDLVEQLQSFKVPCPQCPSCVLSLVLFSLSACRTTSLPLPPRTVG